MIEARANLSFSSGLGFLLAGVRYQVDPELPLVQALVAGGYLTFTEVEAGNGAVDSAGADVLPGVGVGLGVAGREEEETWQGAVDGAGDPESA